MSDNPNKPTCAWSNFLAARARLIHEWRADGKTFEQIAADSRLHDGAHAERIYRATIDSPDHSSAIESAAEQPTGQVYGIIDPDYGRIFTIARAMAWQEGYSCCMQGSFTRDLDLLLTPWTEQARGDAQHLVNRIAEATGLKANGHPPGVKPHGRQAFTLLMPGFGDPRFVDISVMPTTPGKLPMSYDSILDAIDIAPGTPKERLASYRARVAEGAHSECLVGPVTPEEKLQFQEVLFRALRSWEDPPAKWVAMHDRLVGVPAVATRPVPHELYKTGDADAPDAIKDRNGEVVLAQCRKCGKAEIQLDESPLCSKGGGA